MPGRTGFFWTGRAPRGPWKHATSEGALGVLGGPIKGVCAMRWFLGGASVLAVACGGEPSLTTLDEPTAGEKPEESTPAPPAHPADVYDTLDLATLTDEESLAKRMEIGEFVYTRGGRRGLACVVCHQAHGKGIPGAFPPLVGQGDHMGDCAQHAQIILDGLQGKMVVDGVTYQGVMTPQRALLTDLEIASVMTYERMSWGNDYGPCLPSDVAAVR